MDFFSSILRVVDSNIHPSKFVEGSENSSADLKIYNSFCDPIELKEYYSDNAALIENRSNQIYDKLISSSRNNETEIRRSYEIFLTKCNQYFLEKQNNLSHEGDSQKKFNIELGINIRKVILKKFKEKFCQNYPVSIFDIFSRDIALTMIGNDYDNLTEAINIRVGEMYDTLIGSPQVNILTIKENYKKFLTESEKYFEEKKHHLSQNKDKEHSERILVSIEIREKIIDQFKKKYLKEFVEDDLISISSSSSLLSLSPSNSSLPSSSPDLSFQKELRQHHNQDIAKYGENEKFIKSELLEMQTSQNHNYSNFFKNYLLKHLELIKLYKDAKNVMVEKFKKARKGQESVNQEFDQLEKEARNKCLEFLLKNASTLQNLKINNPSKNQHLEKQNSELGEEIAKLRSLLPQIYNPLKSPGQNLDERNVFRFLLDQQRVLIKSDKSPIR